MTMAMDDVAAPKVKWLNRKQAVALLSELGVVCSVGSLANKAANNNAGKGPPFQRSGWKGVRYSETDLRAWAKQYITRVE